MNIKLGQQCKYCQEILIKCFRIVVYLSGWGLAFAWKFCMSVVKNLYLESDSCKRNLSMS